MIFARYDVKDLLVKSMSNESAPSFTSMITPAGKGSMNASAVPAASVPVILQSTTSQPTLQPSFPQHESDQSSKTLGYIFIMVTAVVVIVVASVVVVMLVRKSRINRLRHHLMPLYKFDGTDDDQEEWEAELLDDVSESYSLRRGYKSMEFPSSRNTAGFS